MDCVAVRQREDGIAPGARLVHQNIGTPTGGLASPADSYDLWAQAYRPRDPGSVTRGWDPEGDAAAYRPDEDARTHNNSYGLIVPVLRNVGERDTEDLKRGLENLVRDARARKVPPEELRGHTITLSNYGTIAGRYASPVVVPPQSPRTFGPEPAGREREVRHQAQPVARGDEEGDDAEDLERDREMDRQPRRGAAPGEAEPRQPEDREHRPRHPETAQDPGRRPQRCRILIAVDLARDAAGGEGAVRLDVAPHHDDCKTPPCHLQRREAGDGRVIDHDPKTADAAQFRQCFPPVRHVHQHAQAHHSVERLIGIGQRVRISFVEID